MKKVTIADIAKMAGVSTATVIRVLHNNGYVAEDKRLAVTKVIKETGYVTVSKPRTSDDTRLIGIIQPCSHNLYHQKLLEYLVLYIRRQGYHAVIHILEENDKKAFQEIIKEMKEIGICGAICLADLGNDAGRTTLERLQERKIPVLMLERGGGYGFDRVLVDTKEGVYMAASYLIQSGHTHLAYIGRNVSSEPYEVDVDNDRVNGYKKAIWDHQSRIRESIMEFTEDFCKEQGYLAMKKIWENSSVTGVVATADSLAAGAMEFLYENRINVPGDVSIIGHDDTYAEFLSPALTTIAMPYEEMAKTAVDLIIKREENSTDTAAKRLVLSPKLILRNSVTEVK